MKTTFRDFRKITGFFIFPAIVLIIHIIFMIFGIYDVYSWADIPMHFFGGFSVAVTYFLILNLMQKNGRLIMSGTSKVVFVVSLVALTALLWEFFEFSAEYLTGWNFQGDLTDTMADLFNGLIGGIIASLFSKAIFSRAEDR